MTVIAPVSSQGQVAGPVASGWESTNILTILEPGDLLIGALIQDNTTPSTPTFSDATWTTLFDLNTGGIWLGYRFFAAGDSDRFEPFTTQLHVSVCHAFRFIDPSIAPLSDDTSQAGNTSIQSHAFSGATVDASRNYLSVLIGATYHQSSGLVERSPLIVNFNDHLGTNDGGNAVHVSSVLPKELVLAAEWTQVATGSTPNYYIDGLVSDATDGAEALTALFVSLLPGEWTVGYLPIGLGG